MPTSDTDPRVERTRTRALAGAQSLLLTDGLDAVTHARVAETSGVGRRTLYRHWPDRRSLLHDTLALTRAPEPNPAADLRTGLRTHLLALDAALVRGPLAYIVAALIERSEHDPSFESLRAELVRSGCAPLEMQLHAASARGELPADLDVDAAVAMLEGPVFHTAMLRRRATTRQRIDDIVERFLADPPRAGRRRVSPARRR